MTFLYNCEIKRAVNPMFAPISNAVVLFSSLLRAEINFAVFGSKTSPIFLMYWSSDEIKYVSDPTLMRLSSTS